MYDQMNPLNKLYTEVTLPSFFQLFILLRNLHDTAAEEGRSVVNVIERFEEGGCRPQMVARRKQRGGEVRRSESSRISVGVQRKRFRVLLGEMSNIEAQMVPIVLKSCETSNITVFARGKCPMCEGTIEWVHA